jgi:hypothetical protein
MLPASLVLRLIAITHHGACRQIHTDFSHTAKIVFCAFHLIAKRLKVSAIHRTTLSAKQKRQLCPAAQAAM